VAKEFNGTFSTIKYFALKKLKFVKYLYFIKEVKDTLLRGINVAIKGLTTQ